LDYLSVDVVIICNLSEDAIATREVENKPTTKVENKQILITK
jgi:hypothetical protein